jgi:C4-dicarboxylate transporter, DctM subunit
VFTVLAATFLILMFVVGAPLAITLILSSMAAIWYQSTLSGAAPIPLVVTPQRMFTMIDSFPLMAVPYYILAGELMERGGISLRLVNFATALLGRIRGGICLAAVLSSMIFAGISGSGAADTAAIGSLTIPAMIKKGYPPGWVAALQATAGALGPIIPPSIVMLIYASIANQSPARMFLGGVIPGILIGLGLMLVSYIYSVRHGLGGVEAAMSLRQVLRATADAGWALVAPAIILGGIFTGVFTATEAGIVAVVYAFIVGKYVYREIAWPEVPELLLKAATTTAIVFFIVSASGVFGWLLTASQAPMIAAQFMMSITENRFLVFLIVITFLLIAGGLIEIAIMILILVPVLHPMAQRFGIDPLHWSVILCISLVVGGVTPPVADFLYLATALAKTTLNESARHVWLFVVIMVGVILLCVIFPQLILFLPRLIMG